MIPLFALVVGTLFSDVEHAYSAQNGCGAAADAHMNMTGLEECHFQNARLLPYNASEPNEYAIVYDMDSGTFYKTDKAMSDLERRCTSSLDTLPALNSGRRLTATGLMFWVDLFICEQSFGLDRAACDAATYPSPPPPPSPPPLPPFPPCYYCTLISSTQGCDPSYECEVQRNLPIHEVGGYSCVSGLLYYGIFQCFLEMNACYDKGQSYSIPCNDLSPPLSPPLPPPFPPMPQLPWEPYVPFLFTYD